MGTSKEIVSAENADILLNGTWEMSSVEDDDGLVIPTGFIIIGDNDTGFFLSIARMDSAKYKHLVKLLEQRNFIGCAALFQEAFRQMGH